MRYIIPPIATLSLLLSCDPSGYRKSDDGLFKYKLIHDEAGIEVKEGDKATFTYEFLRNGKILKDGSNKSTTVTIPHKGDINLLLHPLNLMSAGDTLLCKFTLETIGPHLSPKLRRAYKEGETVEFKLAMRNIKTREAIRASQDSVKQRASTVDSLLRTSIKNFKANYHIAQKVGGIRMIVHEEGSGKPYKGGDTAHMLYTAMIVDTGAKFESSIDKGSPFEFLVGTGRGIKGLNQGIQHLRRGSKATLFIPYALGYGPDGNPPNVPIRSDLAYYVEVE